MSGAAAFGPKGGRPLDGASRTNVDFSDVL